MVIFQFAMLNYQRVYLILVGDLEQEFYFSIYWECYNPN